jgi:hypothetical protein
MWYKKPYQNPIILNHFAFLESNDESKVEYTKGEAALGTPASKL